MCPRRIRTLKVLWESGFSWNTLYMPGCLFLHFFPTSWTNKQRPFTNSWCNWLWQKQGTPLDFSLALFYSLWSCKGCKGYLKLVLLLPAGGVGPLLNPVGSHLNWKPPEQIDKLLKKAQPTSFHLFPKVVKLSGLLSVFYQDLWAFESEAATAFTRVIGPTQKFS